MANETGAAVAVAWHEVYTPNLAATKEFYTKLLGWTVQEMPMGDMGIYTMFAADGKPFAGTMETTSPEMQDVPPHWTVYFNTDDVDAAVAKAVEMGGKLHVGPMDVPAVGRMAMIEDPQGACFWVFKGSETT